MVLVGLVNTEWVRVQSARGQLVSSVAACLVPALQVC